MSNPYENEISAINALSSAHGTVLHTRDVATYTVSQVLKAIEALSDVIIAKASTVKSDVCEGTTND